SPRAMGRTMNTARLTPAKSVSVALVALVLAIGIVSPQIARAGDEGSSSPEPATESAAAAAPPAAAATPQLPAYCSGTNDPAKPSWPDPTGAATGVWATPAGDGKGDVPESLKVTDLYDRVAHNLVSINFVWALITGFLVMFMQAGFMFVETGLCRAKN